MVKVSVILTTYNSALYLEQVIDSIFSQRGQDSFKLELIVIDDSSSDNTCDILKSRNINYTSTSGNTGGPNYGRNIGLSKCNGDFIIIADHDDIWLPNRIELLLSVSHFAPIVSSGYSICYPNKTVTERLKNNCVGKNYLLFGSNETFLSKIRRSKKGQQTYLGSIMFSSSLKNIKFEEKYGMLDFDWVLKLFHKQRSVEICEALYIKHIAKDNLSLNEDYRIKDYNYSLEVLNEYRDSYSSAVDLSVKRVNGSLARYYYLIGNMPEARKYFFNSEFTIKTLLYIITTFVGSKIVKRFFNVFG